MAHPSSVSQFLSLGSPLLAMRLDKIVNQMKGDDIILRKKVLVEINEDFH
jgi:hypothetical protein